MDSKDWLYLKLFVGLYVAVTAAAAGADALGAGLGLPAYRLGIYGAVLGTLLVAGGLAGRARLRSRTSDPS